MPGKDDPYAYPGYPEGLKYPWIFPRPSEKERDLRWTTIRKAMAVDKLDAMVVCTLPAFCPSSKHLFYLSNYIPFGAKGVYVVFPREGEGCMVVDNALGPQFVHFASETSWIRDITGTLDPSKELVKKIHRLDLKHKRLGVVGYSQGLFTGPVYDYMRANLNEIAICDASPMMAEAMNAVSRISSEEPVLVEKACESLDHAFQAVIEALKPGVSECELWATVDHELVKRGGWPFHEMFVTSGPRPSFPRVPPSQRILEPGDVVVFEVNSAYGGVNPQSCFACSLGSPANDVQTMFALCQELYGFALTELGKQRTFMEIEQELIQRIRSCGYEPMTPQIHVFNMAMVMPMAARPKPGDYFTVHPNMADPKYTVGAKLGDAVRISKEGYPQRLQKTEAKLHVVTASIDL